MTAGIFNRSIFNNAIFNTGSSGHSGWYRIALEAWQKQALQEYWKAQPKEEEVKPEPIKHKVKENKDGSAKVTLIRKPRKAREKEDEEFHLPEFVPRPMYAVPSEPNYAAFATTILSDLSGMYAKYEPHIARMREKAANDEEDELLILMLAA